MRASPAHFGRIANRMRDADRMECEAFGMSPKQALRLSWRGSTFAMTAFVGDSPEAMFGVAPISAIEGRGSPWFLGTDVVARCARDLIELGPGLLAHMHGSFSTLENRVARDNRAAVRMLQRWGFKIGEDVTSVCGVPFLFFARIQKGGIRVD